MPNKQTLLIRQAKVVNEGQIKTLDILVEGMFIAEIAPISSQVQTSKSMPREDTLPGLIDDQVHFREPGLTHKGP